MAHITLAFGIALILLGLGAYGYALSTESPSITALIPAFVGLPIALLGGAGMKWPGKRAAFIHAAVLLAFIGLAGSARGLMGLPDLITQPDEVERPVAVVVQSVMALLSLVYLVLAVRSFIAARGNNKAADSA